MSERDKEARFVSALLAKAEEDCHRITDEARKTAESVVGDARSRLQAEREERIRGARRRAERELAKKAGDVRERWAKEELSLVDDAYRRSTEAAREELSSLRRRPEYLTLLDGLLDECLEGFPGDARLLVIVDPADETAIAEALSRRKAEGIVVEPGGPFLGGLQVSDPEGRVLVDNTFEARMRSHASEMRLRVAEILGSE